MRIDFDGLHLDVFEDGPKDGPAVVFLHSHGTGAHLWDQCIASLPKGLRLIRYDMRGHRKSDTPAPPYSMGALIRDAEQVLDHLNVRDAVVVGLSIGGMVAQGFAVKRLDLVRALVLVNTSTRAGLPVHWDALIEEIASDGPAASIARTITASFTKEWLENGRAAPWAAQMATLPAEAHIGFLHAIRNTDFYTPTSGLRLPALGIAGSEDKVMPPDMTKETIDLIPGSDFKLIRRSGHLTPLDQPDEFSALLADFFTSIGHLPDLA